jgi:hypothetical protein
MAPAACGNQVATFRRLCYLIQNASQAAPWIPANAWGKLPASHDDHVKSRQFDPRELLEEISRTWTFGVGADFIGLITNVRADEGGEARAQRAAERPVWIGDLPFYCLRNGQKLCLTRFFQLVYNPFESEMNGNRRDDPGPVVNPVIFEEGLGILEGNRKSEVPLNPFELFSALICNQEGSFRIAFDETLGGERSKLSRSKDTNSLRRERCRNCVRGLQRVLLSGYCGSVQQHYSINFGQARQRTEMSNLFNIFDKIAEERIREAIERGEFDDLPGKGEPLNLEDDSHLPQDLRLAYKILKNADCLPPELELRKEIRTTEALLAGIHDTQEKYKQMKKLNYLVMKLNMTRRGSVALEENQLYYERVVDKMTPKKGE